MLNCIERKQVYFTGLYKNLACEELMKKNRIRNGCEIWMYDDFYKHYSISPDIIFQTTDDFDQLVKDSMSNGRCFNCVHEYNKYNSDIMVKKLIDGINEDRQLIISDKAFDDVLGKEIDAMPITYMFYLAIVRCFGVIYISGFKFSTREIAQLENVFKCIDICRKLDITVVWSAEERYRSVCCEKNAINLDIKKINEYRDAESREEEMKRKLDSVTVVEKIEDLIIPEACTEKETTHFYYYNRKKYFLPKIHQGEGCWLVCAGNSLPNYAHALNWSNIPKICINNAVAKKNPEDENVHPTYWVACDMKKGIRYKFPQDLLYGNDCVKIFTKYAWNNEEPPPMTLLFDVFFKPIRPDTWLDQEDFRIAESFGKKVRYKSTYQASCTMLFAFKFAIAVGFKRIAVIGADFHYQKFDSYFHDKNIILSQDAVEKSNIRCDFLNLFFKDLIPYMDRKGVKVVNAQENSNLTAFEKVSFDYAEKWLKTGESC